MIMTENINKELNVIKNYMLDFVCESDELQNILQNFLSTPSKFIRSKVAVLFFKSLGEILSEEQLLIIAATELIHNSSIIHDDVIDGAIIRRGSETLNKMYDNKLSVIAGDYLVSVAIQKLLQIEQPEILKIFVNAVSNMCSSEGIQYFYKNKIPSIEDYLHKTKNKTAELFKACFISVALLSKVQNVSDASEFANNFGIAFQLKNDLDDYKLGIENSDDFKDGIYTAPIILTSSNKNRNLAIEKTLNLIDNYCNKTIAILEKAELNEYKIKLMEIVNSLCK